jgi:AcrR family transcriptional regulator
MRRGVQEQGETMVTVDRRVRRTRAALREALLSLMAEKEYDAVTVQDIIDRADVGRSTFYGHYTDKDDLLHDGLAELRSIVESPDPVAAPGRRRLFGFSLPMLAHVYSHRSIALALFASPRRGRVLDEMQQVVAHGVRDELSALGPPGLPLDAIVSAVVGAYLSLVTWWLRDAPALGPDEVDRMFHALVAPGVRAALRRE